MVLLPIIVIAFGVGLVMATQPSGEQPLSSTTPQLGNISPRDMPLSKLDIELVMDVD